jgi:ribonuclease Z
MDCGEGFTRRLLEQDVDPKDIEVVSISHGHADHLAGIVGFLWQNWLVSHRENILEIVAPSYIFPRIQSLMDLVSTPPGALTYPMKFMPIDEERPLDECEVSLSSTGTEQGITITRQHAPGIHDPASFATRFNIRDAGDGTSVSICYSGDTTPVHEIAELAAGCNLLIHECTYLDEDAEKAAKVSHSTPSGVGKIATEANVGKLVLTHYSVLLEGREDEFAAQAAETFAGPIVVARDLMEIDEF